MKTTRSVAMLAVVGANLCSGQSATAPEGTAIVCIPSNPSIQMGVRPLASAMFATIGVKLDWRERDSCPVGVGAIKVRLSPDSRRLRDTKALAFTQPYEGSIVVFLDRVQALSRNGMPSV